MAYSNSLSNEFEYAISMSIVTCKVNVKPPPPPFLFLNLDGKDMVRLVPFNTNEDHCAGSHSIHQGAVRNQWM